MLPVALCLVTKMDIFSCPLIFYLSHVGVKVSPKFVIGALAGVRQVHKGQIVLGVEPAVSTHDGLSWQCHSHVASSAYG